MTREQIIKAGYHLHHISYGQGYIRVNVEIIKKYSGRFGKGYKIYSHNTASTRYCWVEYFTK